jgi:hypothetical protein
MMHQITNTQIERGVGLAQREGDLRWEWADLAFEVEPPSEGRGMGNGQDAKLGELRTRVAANGDIAISDLPSVDLLRRYRDAAAALPPEARAGVTVNAALELGRFSKDKAERLAVVERLRAEHPTGRVIVDAIRAYFGRVPTRASGRPAERAEADLKRSTHKERVHVASTLMDDPVVERDVYRRPKRVENWNGKTNPKRERELRQRKKAGDYAELVRAQLRINELCSALEATTLDDFDLDAATLAVIIDLHDDLLTLASWVDRKLSHVGGWLKDSDVRATIAKLREQTVANGSEPGEEANAKFLIARLERKLEARLVA